MATNGGSERVRPTDVLPTEVVRSEAEALLDQFLLASLHMGDGSEVDSTSWQFSYQVTFGDRHLSVTREQYHEQTGWDDEGMTKSIDRILVRIPRLTNERVIPSVRSDSYTSSIYSSGAESPRDQSKGNMGRRDIYDAKKLLERFQRAFPPSKKA